MAGPTVVEICKANAGDLADILGVINAGAVAYKDVIPADTWHEPYMLASELEQEMSAGVHFVKARIETQTIGVMGVQDKGKVVLIRHAYVVPHAQRQGVGGKLLRDLVGSIAKPVLIGTWAAANWAIAFYEKHGFSLVNAAQKDVLLREYWTVPERQIASSVVLGDRAWRCRQEHSL